MEQDKKVTIVKEGFLAGNIFSCPDYDSDCVSMTHQQASICFMGGTSCPVSKMFPSLGIAQGYCPIIHRDN